MNECGTCTLCCKLTAVPELKKPVNSWCEYCADGKKCAIYGDHPKACKDYRCIWLTGGLSKELKPEKCHVIFERVNRHIYLALTDPEFPMAWNEPIVKDVIDSFVNAGRSVLAGSGPGNPRKLFYPTWKNPENIMFEAMTIAKSIGALA